MEDDYGSLMFAPEITTVTSEIAHVGFLLLLPRGLSYPPTYKVA